MKVEVMGVGVRRVMVRGIGIGGGWEGWGSRGSWSQERLSGELGSWGG